MQDRLIFPTRLEQIATGEIVHDNFPTAKWITVDEIDYCISDIDVDVSLYLFFDWAYRTPGGSGPILLYCLNLSMELLIAPTDWMLDVVARHKTLQLGSGT